MSFDEDDPAFARIFGTAAQEEDEGGGGEEGAPAASMEMTTEGAKKALEVLEHNEGQTDGAIPDPFEEIEKQARLLAEAGEDEGDAEVAAINDAGARGRQIAKTLKKKRKKKKKQEQQQAQPSDEEPPPEEERPVDEVVTETFDDEAATTTSSQQFAVEETLKKSARRRKPKEAPSQRRQSVEAPGQTGAEAAAKAAAAQNAEAKKMRRRKSKDPRGTLPPAAAGDAAGTKSADDKSKRRKKKKVPPPPPPPPDSVPNVPMEEIAAPPEPTIDDDDKNDALAGMSKKEKRQKSKEELQKLKAKLTEALEKKEAEEEEAAINFLAPIPEDKAPVVVQEATMEDIKDVFGIEANDALFKATQMKHKEALPADSEHSLSTVNLDEQSVGTKRQSNHKTKRDAPVDLLSAPLPEQRPPPPEEMDSLLRPHPTNNGGMVNGGQQAPINDPEELVARYHQAEKEREQKMKLVKMAIIGLGFLFAVGFLAIIFTFAIGWGKSFGGDNNNNNAPVVGATTASLGDIYLPASALVEGTEAALSQPESPQYRAYHWLDKDPRRAEYSEWQLVQRFAVATMYFSMRKTTGPTNEEPDTWLSYDQSECDWGGPSGDVNPPQCDDNGRMQNLDLTSVSGVQDDLVTSLPKEITLLDQLERLGIARNGVFVQWVDLMPTEMQRIASTYRIMNVAQNEIHNLMHPNSVIFKMSNLQELDASTNLLTGSIPTEFDTLQELRRLDLSQNSLSGTIPSLRDLSKLEYLSLAGNKIGGEIPPYIGLMFSLKWLDLGETSVTGALPTHLGQSSSLVSLDLRKTVISGGIPSEIGLLGPTLRRLDLSENGIAGTVPTEVGRLSTLQFLSLSLTALEGSIPTEIGGLTSTVDLRLSNTLLAGSLPTQLGSMASLKFLEVAGSSHAGPICSEIGQLGNTLERLDLSKNAFTGALPTQVGLLTKVTFLDLSVNFITGRVPSELDRLAAAQVIDISGNLMTGQLPSFQDATSVRVLRLGGNYYTGSTLPTQLGLLTQLVELDLSDTVITGTIPTEYGDLTNLEVLKLGSEISGEIPAGICGPQLTTLSVNCNKVQCGNCKCDCLR